jgi:hypothetical protein
MRVATGWDVLQQEIREEQATTIGRLSRELEESLAALRDYDRKGIDRTVPERKRLVDAAGYALWNFVVQRDCAGMRFTEKFLRDFNVPAEVRAKMGVVRPR